MLALGALAVAPALGAELHWAPRPADQRSFDDRSPIPVRARDDGRPLEIRSWITELRRSLIPGVERFPGGEIEYYVSFALGEPGRSTQRPLFRFRYGTENGGYRSYSLVEIGDADGDGRTDFALHLGGELPQELVVLLDRGEEFEARTSGPLPPAVTITPELEIIERRSAGTSALDATSRRLLASWSARDRRFAGDGLLWVIGAAATVRESLAADAGRLGQVEGGAALRRVAIPGPEALPEGWLPVELDGVRGWISARVVESMSPEERR